LLLPVRSGAVSREIRNRTPTLCQNDRAGMEVRPELCRAPVRNTTPQAIRVIIIAQNARPMATAAATSITKENLSLIFHLLSKGEAQS